MLNYVIVENDTDAGLSIIKILDGEFEGLLLSLYNIGCSEDKLYYSFSILNEMSETDNDKLENEIMNIVDNIYFEENL